MTNLVLYDGLCGLCNSTVLLLLKIDRRRALTFAPLQGETAKRISLPPQTSETIIYVLDSNSGSSRIFLRSDAIVEILHTIGGVWELAVIFRIVPRRIRDAVYEWIARNRYDWFGKFEVCKLPATDQKSRFLP